MSWMLRGFIDLLVEMKFLIKASAERDEIILGIVSEAAGPAEKCRCLETAIRVLT